tara:strand:+ start:181 stop:531 length:351 start_codon:yes stop_codon:yes gene_type:complete
MLVLAVTPVPVKTCPTERAPDATAVTVIVVPLIEAVNDAVVEYDVLRTIFCVEDHTDPSAVNSTLPAVVGEMLAPSPPLAIGSVPVTPVDNGNPVALVSVAETGVPSAVMFPDAFN